MPFIDSRLSVKVSAEQKDNLKTEFGRMIGTLHKSENYLMVEIEDDCDLWMGGKKLDKCAYVAVSLFGNASGSDYDCMTKQICDLLTEKLGIPGSAIYVTYHPVSDWGWNGGNF